MSCTHIWTSPRRGFEMSFRTLSISLLCYHSAEHQELTCICPLGSTAPSFQLLQGQWEIGAVGKAYVFPPAPGHEPGCTPWSTGSSTRQVPSCLPFMGAAPTVGAASAPRSHAGKPVPREGCKCQSRQAKGWGLQDFPEAIKARNVSAHHQPLATTAHRDWKPGDVEQARECKTA